MWSLRNSHGIKNLLISQSLVHHHTTLFSSKPISPPKFMVDYLIETLNFTTQEAISASTKVSHLKSIKNCDSVLETFKKHGFDDTQLKTMIYSAPKMLLHKPGKTLEPKLRFLKDVGFSASDVVFIVSKSPSVFNMGLKTKIMPRLGYLRDLLGSDDNVVKVVRRAVWLLSISKVVERLRESVVLLRERGLSNQTIERLVIYNVRAFVFNFEWFSNVIDRVQGELGIPVDSNTFIKGIRALGSNSSGTLEKKLGVFRSFGWSPSDVSTIINRDPLCLTISEDKIRNGLVFYMNELGYSPAYIAARPCLLLYSLEKRVKPRNEVLKVLKENQLVNCERCLYTIVPLLESKFLERYVLPYEDVLPDLRKKYTNSIC